MNEHGALNLFNKLYNLADKTLMTDFIKLILSLYGAS